MADSGIAANPDANYLYVDRANIRLERGDLAGAREDVASALRTSPPDYQMSSQAIAAALDALAGDTAGGRARLERVISQQRRPLTSELLAARSGSRSPFSGSGTGSARCPRSNPCGRTAWTSGTSCAIPASTRSGRTRASGPWTRKSDRRPPGDVRPCPRTGPRAIVGGRIVGGAHALSSSRRSAAARRHVARRTGAGAVEPDARSGRRGRAARTAFFDLAALAGDRRALRPRAAGRAVDAGPSA